MKVRVGNLVIELEGKSLAKIIVRNNGIGFNPEHAEKTFATFTCLNSKDK